MWLIALECGGGWWGFGFYLREAFALVWVFGYKGFVCLGSCLVATVFSFSSVCASLFGVGVTVCGWF